MSTLLQEIEAQIAGVKATTAKQNVGTVRQIGDGVAKIEGLTDAMLNEMLDFGNGVVGLALNLKKPKSAPSSWVITSRCTKAPRSRPPASCSRCPSARDCSAAWWIRSAARSTAKARSKKPLFIPLKKLRPAS